MISLICCSHSNDIPKDLRKNISLTIGTEFELIVIDNSKNDYTIFSAYNKGVQCSKGSIICFMHEDILFHSNDWGKNVISHLASTDVGLIGIVGCHYLPNCPAAWWTTKCSSGNFIQGNSDHGVYQRKETWLYDYGSNIDSSVTVDVTIVDGFWFCIKRELFDFISFDCLTYSGFHVYDMDICMQVWQNNKRVQVIYDVLIEHFSKGTTDKTWFESLEIFHSKWHKSFPFVKGISLTEKERNDRFGFARDLYDLKKEFYRLEAELLKCNKSQAYRLGRMLLYPFSLALKFLKLL